LPKKIRLPLISFFSLGKLHLGKLHRERAVIGRIFQALPTQTDTTIVAFPGVTENDRLWAGVCPGRPALPYPCPALFIATNRQTPCLLLYIGCSLLVCWIPYDAN